MAFDGGFEPCFLDGGALEDGEDDEGEAGCNDDVDHCQAYFSEELYREYSEIEEQEGELVEGDVRLVEDL